MARKFFILFLSAVLTAICCSAALCEKAGSNSIICGEDWSWNTGAYNTFDGELDLSDFAGRELSIHMTTDLPYSGKAEQESMPVFTLLNGKRITMHKQTDTIRCTTDSGDPVIRFSGRFRMPEKKHVRQITFQFGILDEDGQELKSVSVRLGGGENSTGAYYIPVDIHTVTLCIGIAAAALWAFILVRRIPGGKKQKTGE